MLITMHIPLAFLCLINSCKLAYFFFECRKTQIGHRNDGSRMWCRGVDGKCARSGMFSFGSQLKEKYFEPTPTF